MVKKLRRHGISPAPKRKQSVPCKKIRELVKTGSVNPLRLPARSPDLNSYAERCVRVDQNRVSVEADIVWRIVAAMSVAAIYRALPRGAQSSRQRQSDLVSLADRGKKEHGSSAVAYKSFGCANLRRSRISSKAVRWELPSSVIDTKEYKKSARGLLKAI